MFFLPLRGASPKTRIPFVNYFIIAANILIFFYTFPFSLSLSDVGQFVALLKTYSIVPGNLKFHMLITSAFLHANIFHVGFNMLFLWVFGGNIEDNLGHICYLFFYIAAAIVSPLPHIILNPNSFVPLIGASGAISGVLGAYAVLYPGSRVTTLFIPFYFIIAVRIVSIRAVWFLCFWFALQILGGLVGLFGPQSEGGVAYSAHIAGFLFGFAIALIGLATHLLSREKRYKYDIWGDSMKPDETPIENAEKQAKTYAIFKETAERMNIVDIGKTVAKVVRLPLADVTTRLFVCSGFIADNLTETQKNRICELLQEISVSYFVVEQKDVLQLPALETVETGAFDSCGFQFTSAGETTTYTWENILLVNAARFQTVSRRLQLRQTGQTGDERVPLLTTALFGIPILQRPRSKKTKTEIVKEITHHFAIDVFVKTPYSRFRIFERHGVPEHPDQSVLIAELERFRALAQNIAQFATDTFVGDAVKALAEGGDLSEFTYDAKRKFDLLNFYLVNLAQHLKQDK